MDIIKPTVGRKVWFRPNGATGVYGTETAAFVYMTQLDGQPLDATILFVWSDTCVNLRVTDHSGKDFFISSASIANASDGVAYWEWMPYQLGQAAKHAEQVNTAVARTMTFGAQ